VRRKMRTTVVEEGGRGRGVIVAEPVVPVSSGCYTSLVFALFIIALLREEEQHEYRLD
jgi:hypothetical protein